MVISKAPSVPCAGESGTGSAITADVSLSRGMSVEGVEGTATDGASGAGSVAFRVVSASVPVPVGGTSGAGSTTGCGVSPAGASTRAAPIPIATIPMMMARITIFIIL